MAHPALAVPIPANTHPAQTHCPYEQAALLQQVFVSGKIRVGLLLGAGCPVAIRVPDGAGAERPLIPDIRGLTAAVREQLEASPSAREPLARALKRLSDSGGTAPNIEVILSHIRALQDVVHRGTIDGLTRTDLDQLDTSICAATNEIVNQRLPAEDTPYHQIATWIGAIQRIHPVEIFTSNYDLLMEQALEEREVPYFDGFIGTDRTFFDLTAMEQDRLPPRWARLWKVHGSINWWKTAGDKIQRRAARERVSGEPGDRLLIHPSHLKYAQSRRMPYLAMLDRLRAFLSSGQSALITCGYSYSDHHLNEIIFHSLGGNPQAICFGLLWGDRGSSPEATRHARERANFSLLAADGAIVGTVDREWHTQGKPERALHDLAVRAGDLGYRTTAPAERCKFLLGDFRALGSFVAQELSRRGDGHGGQGGQV